LFFANKKDGFRWEVVRFIQETCRALNITVIHTHHIGPLIYGSLAIMGLNINHVHTEHDVWHLQKFKLRLIQTVFFKLNRKMSLVDISDYVYTCLKRFYPKMSINLIPNAVDTKVFMPGDKKIARNKFNIPDSATVIGCAGRLETIKGQTYLIEAMNDLPSNYHLVMAGMGSLYETLLAQVQHDHLSNRVHFFGVVDNMTEFYQACDILCLPSLNEGMPLVLLEAQACNVPVVSSDVGSCLEEVDPESGLLIPAKDPKAIARACLQITQKSGNPRDFILTHYRFEDMLAHYHQLYQGLKLDPRR
jgi:glycosyltransferase involved in cell wall biosynthesis